MTAPVDPFDPHPASYDHVCDDSCYDSPIAFSGTVDELEALVATWPEPEPKRWCSCHPHGATMPVGTAPGPFDCVACGGLAFFSPRPV